MRESVVEEEVRKYAEARGWFCRKLMFIGRRNCPDRMFAKDGRCVFVEFKKPGEKPRPGQDREIKRMRRAGLDVHVVDDVTVGCALFG